MIEFGNLVANSLYSGVRYALFNDSFFPILNNNVSLKKIIKSYKI